ncbi:MAG: hypothetical protein ACLFOY_01035 [Desulfatibacillaceae bacterium]
MQDAFLAHPRSEFINRTLSRLLERYDVTCILEGDCAEYHLMDRGTGEEISEALVLSLNRFANRIEVIRFYPRLNLQSDAKYLSAACFYLLVHHFAHAMGLPGDYTVFVRTTHEVFGRFYQSLLDWEFHRVGTSLCDTVDIVSEYHDTGVDTDMVALTPWDDSMFLVA